MAPQSSLILLVVAFAGSAQGLGCYVYNQETQIANSDYCPSEKSTSCLTFNLKLANGKDHKEAGCSALTCAKFEANLQRKFARHEFSQANYTCCNEDDCNDHGDAKQISAAFPKGKSLGPIDHSHETHNFCPIYNPKDKSVETKPCRDFEQKGCAVSSEKQLNGQNFINATCLSVSCDEFIAGLRMKLQRGAIDKVNYRCSPGDAYVGDAEEFEMTRKKLTPKKLDDPSHSVLGNLLPSGSSGEIILE